MKPHFGFSAFMGKAKGYPYDKQFRFTLNSDVSFLPMGRGNSTWQSVETVRQLLGDKMSPHCFHKHIVNILLP